MDHLYLIQEGGLGFALRQHDGVPVRLLGSSRSKINHLHNLRHWQLKLDSRLLLLTVSQMFQVETNSMLLYGTLTETSEAPWTEYMHHYQRHQRLIVKAECLYNTSLLS